MPEKDCLFCGFASKKVPTDLVYEDELMVAFNDISPRYPVHVLLVPKKHIASAAAADLKDAELLGKMLLAGARIARERGLSERGFRLLTNIGEEAGQSVKHLHIHLLGGKKLRPV